MADFKLQSDFSPAGDQPQAISSLIEGLESKSKEQVLLGITGSGKTFTMANVIEKVQKPTLILSHNKTLAAQLYGEFRTLFPDNAVEFFISYYDYYQPEAYLPVTDTFIEKDSSVNEEIDRLRLKATTSLMSRDDVIIIASVSCIYGIGSPDSYKDMLVEVKLGQKVHLNSLFKELIAIHYNRNDMVLEPGVFRSRGDTVEIFPKYEHDAIRIEFFDDEIDRIIVFDPMTMKIKQDLDRYYVYPAKHFVTSRENINRAIGKIRKELHPRLDELRKTNKLLEAQRLEQRTLFDIEMMMELGYCSGIENYSRHIDGRKKGERPFTLMDYYPKDFLFFIDESHVSIPQVKAMYNGDRSRKESLVEHGFRLPSALDNRPLKFEEFSGYNFQTIYVSATPGPFELKHSDKIVEQVIRPTGLIDPVVTVKPSSNQVEDILSEITSVIKNNNRILITTLTKKMAENLTEYLDEFGVKVQYLHSDINTVERVEIIRDLRKGEFDVLVGINLLREGLDIPEVELVGILDADKEGFLRSDKSLIQTMGRAARNIDGRVILYGDTITNSMQRAIDETERRRKIQTSFNKLHNIKPESIKKAIKDALDNDIYVSNKKLDKLTLISNVKKKFPKVNGNNVTSVIKELEKHMFMHAKNLEFEKAAHARDQISAIEENFLDMPKKNRRVSSKKNIKY